MTASTVVERCYVYRFFDADGGLLYVGITRDVGSCFAEHRRTAAWWIDVVSCEFSAVTDRQAAEYAEAVAIVAERPSYNAARPTARKLLRLDGQVTGSRHADVLRLVAEAERLRRVNGDQYVRLARLECDRERLLGEVESLRVRLGYALSDVRLGDGLLAQARTALALARQQVGKTT